MSADKHTLQQWVAGAELRVKKSHQPLAGVPLVNRVGRLAKVARSYVHTEKIDLTRAKNFRVQESSEDLVTASIDLPVFGKRGVGNTTGLALASFDYMDQEEDEHAVVAICAYELSGVVQKKRELKKVLIIPMA